MAVRDGKEVIPTPIWVLVVRIFQFILSLIVIGAAGWIVHGYYFPSLGFSIICSLFTWIIFVYQILVEKVASCRGAYNTWAVLSLDGLMIIFWLASMGAVADLRSGFTYDVTVTGCSSNGKTINSETCTVEKRGAVASQAGLGAMSGVAGVSALIMLLFVATFAYVCHKFRLAHSSGLRDPEKFNNSNSNNFSYSAPSAQYNAHANAGTEMTSNMPAAQQAEPLLNQGQPQYPAQASGQPKWAEHQYAQQPTGYAQQQQQGYPAPQYDPYTQQTGYAGSGGVYSPDHVGQPQQVPYNPNSTPVSGAPIYQVPPHQ